MSTKWYKLSEKLPEEKTSPLTLDFLEYPCIFRSAATGEREVRFYKFGRGHFWHGPEIFDQRIEAWAERPEINNSAEQKQQERS